MMNRKKKISCSDEYGCPPNIEFQNPSRLIKLKFALTIESDALKNFLDSRKEDILNGLFIPTKPNILSELPSLSSYKGLNKTLSTWIKNNTPFQNLTELKKSFLEIPLSSRYSDKDILEWKELIERNDIKTFKDASSLIQAVKGFNILPSTIKRLLEQIFNIQGWDFYKWVRNLGFQVKYVDEEIEEWIKLLERPSISSFQQLCDYLLLTKGNAPKGETIRRNIEDYFNNRGLDFYEWVRQNTKYSEADSEEGKIIRNISRDDILLWIRVLERPEISSYSQASRSLNDEFGIEIDPSLMRRNVIKFFESEGREYSEWQDSNEIIKLYTEEDVFDWKRLLERPDIKTFPQASHVIREMKGFGPTYVTLKERLRDLFHRNGWDFGDWLKKYRFRYSHPDEDVEEKWVPKFEELGSFQRVGDIFGIDAGTVKNRIKLLLGDYFLDWFNKYSKLDIYQSVGTYIHYLLQLLFLDFVFSKKSLGFYEIQPSYYDNDFLCDNALLLTADNNFNRYLLSKLPRGIILWTLDYTLGSEDNTYIKKSNKFYHSNGKFLTIISLLTTKSNKKVPSKAINRTMMSILNANEFASFIGYYGEYLERFNDIIRLAKRVLREKEQYKILQRHALKTNNILKKKYGSYSNQMSRLLSLLRRRNLLHILHSSLQ